MLLHGGGGTGYYTALLAELAGSIEAYEIETSLAAQAMANLAARPNVTVHAAAATGRALPTADATDVNAGATHPDPYWLDALRDGGRLLFPLTGADSWSGMLPVTRVARHFAARFASGRGFIDYPVEATRLSEVFRNGGQDRVGSLTRQPSLGATVWFAGDDGYLSIDPPS